MSFWTVMGDYPDYTAMDNKGSFYLSPNRTMHPDHWMAPITWTGNVGGIDVEFTQIQTKSSSIDDFDFSSCPPAFEKAKTYIVQAIDKKLRIMD